MYHISSLVALLSLVVLLRAYDLSRQERRLERTSTVENCVYNFCNYTEDYPAERIRAILQRHPNYKLMFGDIAAPHRHPRGVEVAVGADGPCESSNHVVFPRLARNTVNVWKTIVNVDQLRQEVFVDICQNDGQPCSGSATGNCRQRFEKKDMWVANEKGLFVLDTFILPAGCVCGSLNETET